MDKPVYRVSELSQILFKEEDLNPELEKCMEKTKIGNDFFDSIKHPLVFSIFHAPALNALVNEQLRVKKAAAEKALEDQDWSQYIYLHERPYRIHALMNIMDELEDKEYWELLRDVWIDSENLGQHLAIMPILLCPTNRDLSLRPIYLMEEEERKVLESIPDPDNITIYRGYAHRNKLGWSWTFSPSKALWFAKRFQDKWKTPKVIQGICKREDIIAFFNERGENEVVINPRKISFIKDYSSDSSISSII